MFPIELYFTLILVLHVPKAKSCPIKKLSDSSSLIIHDDLLIIRYSVNK